MKALAVMFGVVILAIAGSLAYLEWFAPCVTPPASAPIAGSHGYRIWFGQDMRTFEHYGRAVCVPEGWEAVGAERVGDGWAKFENGTTAILVRPEMFTGEVLEFGSGMPNISLRYSVSLSSAEIGEYTDIVRRAFQSAGSLFNPEREDEVHTVLVTSALRNNQGEPEQVYPDPRESVTLLAYPAGHPRTEETMLHAAMHLFNRHYKELTVYQKRQAPVPAGDFQELEASWAETAFRSDNAARDARLVYLYNVHLAVVNKDFSRISAPPFNNKEAFEAIAKPSVAVPGSANYLDAQYGHYILAPLVMVGIEGLLDGYGAQTDVAQILKELHTGEAQNFFEELYEALPENEVARIERWMFDNELIPYDLIVSGSKRYAK